jgi:hypothetical protein
VKPNLVKRGPMRRRLRILRRRREAMLLDLGALVLEMHRHGRFLPDSLQRRAAEAVGTDAELRALSRSLEAGDGDPDLVAAGIAGNCSRCGALHTIGSAYCSQCGNELAGGVLPRKAALGRDPELAGGAPVPRRTVAAAPVVTASAAAGAAGAAAATEGEAESAEATEATKVIEPEETAAESPPEPGPEPAATNGGSAPPPPPISRRARATRVRQRLDEPSRSTQALPTGLLAGIAAGLLVIVVGILVLSSGDGGDDEPNRAAQAPAQNEPEPPPPDEAPTQSGPAAGGQSATPAALEPVEDVTATAYDPTGDDSEHDEEADLAVDGDASTSWPTEEYDTGSFQKDGVGLVLAPAEGVPARGLDVETTTPGFDVTIYGADSSVVPDSIDSGWTEIANEEGVERKGRIDLDSAGSDFTHYLIWITTLPGDENKVEITEAQLLR